MIRSHMPQEAEKDPLLVAQIASVLSQKELRTCRECGLARPMDLTEPPQAGCIVTLEIEGALPIAQKYFPMKTITTLRRDLTEIVAEGYKFEIPDVCPRTYYQAAQRE